MKKPDPVYKYHPKQGRVLMNKAELDAYEESLKAEPVKQSKPKKKKKEIIDPEVDKKQKEIEELQRKLAQLKGND